MSRRDDVASTALVAAALALSSCGGGQPSRPAAERGQSRPSGLKIGFLLDDTHERWERDRNMFVAQALDKARNNVVAVVASNDVAPGGVIDVLEKRNLAGKVLVSGQDAELEAARRIVAGTQAMTVYKPIGALARLAARAAIQLANGEKVDAATTVDNGKKPVPTMLLDPIVVDRTNLDTVLIGDGFHRREAVYGAGR